MYMSLNINQPMGGPGTPTGGPVPPTTNPTPFGPSSPLPTNPPSTAPGSVPPSTVNPSVPSGVTTSLIYPPELATGGVRLAFSFYTYTKPSVFNPTKLTPTGDFIFLPIPDGIVDQYNIGYQPYDPSYMAQLVPEATGAAEPFMSGVWSSIKNSFNTARTLGGDPSGKLTAAENAFKSSWASAEKSFGRISWSNKENYKYAIVSGLATFGGLFEGSAQSIVDNSFGTTLNPNSTVALKAPQLRTHSFTWTVSAKSQNDSNIINQIINQFKFNMLPNVTQERFFLSYPSLVYPEFIGTNQYLYTFKPSLITGFTALPVAGGQPSFFNDTHAPTIIQIQLQLLEVEMFLQSDVNISENPGITRAASIKDLSSAESAITNATTSDDTNVLGIGANANE